jgi:hypothetical protein
MDKNKQVEFVRRRRLAKGGPVRRKLATGGNLVSGTAQGAALGSVVPGIGTAIGAIGGFITSLFGGGPQPPNITDPVTGQQITNAAGQVVASQATLQNYANTLQGQNGAQNQQQAFQAVNQVYQGQGPNPAAAMLAEATGQTVANTEALMASQRGAAQNVGLIAREAAQQGANTQQQAVGQAATIESQQQLNALGQEAGISNSQVQNTIQAQTAAGNLAAENQNQLLGAQGTYQGQVTQGQGNVNAANASITNQSAVPLAAGALSGAGTATALLSSATPTAGTVNGIDTSTSYLPPTAPGSSTGLGSLPPNQTPYAKGGKVIEGPHKSHVANFLAMSDGGKVPALVSPGEIYLSPDHVKEVQHGANPLKLGHKIPGKAKVKGDSLKNDTVEATLQDGGVVLPRHIVKGMSPERAQLFVLKSLAKRRAK